MTRLAIIAGKGQLPVEVAAAATASGFDVLILPINGQADADFTAYRTMPIRLGAIGETRAVMVQHKIEKLVMVGKVSWPSMAALRPDFDGVKLLGKMMTTGDVERKSSLTLEAELYRLGQRDEPVGNAF